MRFFIFVLFLFFIYVSIIQATLAISHLLKSRSFTPTLEPIIKELSDAKSIDEESLKCIRQNLQVFKNS